MTLIYLYSFIFSFVFVVSAYTILNRTRAIKKQKEDNNDY